jgi:hypothetical protein
MKNHKWSFQGFEGFGGGMGWLTRYGKGLHKKVKQL